MGFELRPHQERNIDSLVQALRRFGGAIDMSCGGTGKSLTFLGLCKKVNAQPIVVTRKAILSGWEEDCEKIGIKPLLLTNYEALTRGNHPLCKKVVTARKADGSVYRRHYDWQSGLGRVLFAFDESQSCGRMSTESSQVMLAAVKQYKTCLMSATPFATPLQAGPTLCALRLTQKDRWHMEQLQFGCYESSLGGMAFIGDKPDGELQEKGTNAKLGLEYMEKLHRMILPERGVRTKRSEIPDFPQTLITPMCVDLPAPSEMVKVYLDLVAEARLMDLERVKEQLDPVLWDIAEVLPCVEDLRYRQETEIRSLPVFEQMIEDALEKGDSVAVFLNFDHSINALARRFKTDNIIRGKRKGNAEGGAKSYDRGQRIWRFRNNLDRLIILNSAAGGAGISLHDSDTQVPRTCLISPPWSAQVLKQVLFRPHRLGGGFSRQYLIFPNNRIGQRVKERVTNRKNNIDMLTDGDLTNSE